MYGMYRYGLTDPVVGLVGSKRVGKSYFADILADNQEYTVVPFAEPLKSALLEVNPRVDGVLTLRGMVEFYGWDFCKNNPEVRRLLQSFGDATRNLDPYFWIDVWKNTALSVGGPVVAPDVRYENEAEAIRDCGGALVRVVNANIENDDPHPSETVQESIECDATVFNRYDREGFEKAADIVADIAAAGVRE